MVTSSTTSKDTTTIKSKKYRGRLSEKSVSLSIFDLGEWKVWTYIGTWTLTSLDYWIFAINIFVIPKFALLVLHYANKVHLIIFNLVFVDAAW